MGDDHGGVTVRLPLVRIFGRLLLGGLALSEQILRVPMDRHADVPAEPSGPLPPPAVRHILVGALLAARSTLVRYGCRLRPARAVAGRWARRWSRSRRVIDGARRRVSAWGQRGVREEAEARVLTLSLGRDLAGVTLAMIAESPELQAVMHEQSAGFTKSALDEIRSTSARADAAAGAVTRRLLGSRARDR